MKWNIGNIDRIIRFALAVIVGGLGIAFGSWFGLLGLVPLLTASVGTCPLYLPFGISTKAAEKKAA